MNETISGPNNNPESSPTATSVPVITPAAPADAPVPTTPTSAVTSKKSDRFWTTLLIFMFIVAAIRLFVIDPFLVHGSSMEPTFHEGDYVIVDKLTYKLNDPQRGDVIVFDAPTNDGRYFIKRIIGLPGEKVNVEGANVTIYNKDNMNGFKISEPYVTHQSDRVREVVLGQDEYFVMGDNRSVSSDSRVWGALKFKDIQGKAAFRALPTDQSGFSPGGIDKFEGVVLP